MWVQASLESVAGLYRIPANPIVSLRLINVDHIAAALTILLAVVIYAVSWSDLLAILDVVKNDHGDAERVLREDLEQTSRKMTAAGGRQSRPGPA